VQLSLRFPFQLWLMAVVAGLLASLVIALVSSARTDAAISADITEAIRNHIYTPIADADEHARLLASHADIREGIAERNAIRLRRALAQAIRQTKLSYVGILLPDGKPYYSLPDHDPDAPIIARRITVEHELRAVGTLQYGAMLTEGFVRDLGSALATDVHLAGDQAELPTNSPAAASPQAEVFARVSRRGENGLAYLRAPNDPSGPVLAVLEFRVPTTSPGTRRVERTRNVLWGLTAIVVLVVAGYDLRKRKARAQPPAAFLPIANPYIVGNPIRTSDMFFGREDDFQFAHQKLASERAGLVLVFCGERRSGKTSILFQILNGRLGPEFVPVLIDMQYFAAISRDRDFYDSVVKEFVRAVYPESEQHERRRRFDLPSEGPAQSFEVILDDAMEAHPAKTFLFLFDEYEILESKIDREELSRMVIPYLAGLLERKGRISFIFTGSRNLEERSTFHWRLMMGKSLYRKISYLTKADTERLIRNPVQGLVDYDAAAVSMIYRLTSGQPFYTQVICQNLVDHLNELRRRTVGSKDVLTIVDAIVDNPLPQMIYFWDSLPVDEKIALSLLAETLGDESGWESADGLLANMTDKGVTLDTELVTLNAALERLFEKELLAKSGDRTFQYRVDLLRHWIRRTHSIWQVVKETRSVPLAGA
jgi:AAA+ ATPase superfamily predicted ATPase